MLLSNKSRTESGSDAICNSAIFFFDWTQISGDSYSKQIFKKISNALTGSCGLCAFHDGDILGTNVISRLNDLPGTTLISATDSDGKNNSLEDLKNNDPSIDSYAAAMWSDTSENFEILHTALIKHNTNGYLGCIQFGEVDRFQFLSFAYQNLSLSQGVVFQDGKIIPETDKYDIGSEYLSAHLALLDAAQKGDLRKIKEALNDGANVNFQTPNERGDCALMRAVLGNYPAIVDCLLSAGANPNVSNLSSTVLMLAARYGYLEIVQLLIENGVDVNLSGRGGFTALDESFDETDADHIAITQLLLANGAIHGTTDSSDPNEYKSFSTSASKAAGEAGLAFNRYLEYQQPEDLDIAIKLMGDALERTESYASELSSRQALFGRAMHERFRRDGTIEDLELAITFHWNAIRHTNSSNENIPVYFSGLGNALLDRGIILNNIEDIQQSVKTLRIPVQINPDDCLHQHNLATALLNLLKNDERNDDLHNEVVKTRQLILRTAEKSDLHYLRYVASYAEALTQRAQFMHDAKDCALAISACNAALEHEYNSLSLKSIVYEQKGLAELTLYDLYGYEQDLFSALDSLQKATSLAADISPVMALNSARLWLFTAFTHTQWSEVTQAYEYLESVTESLVFNQLFRDQSESWLKDIQHLAAQAAFSYIKLNDPIKAVLALENGLARLLTHALKLETIDLKRLDDAGQHTLRSEYETLVQKIQQLEKQSKDAVVDPTTRQAIKLKLSKVVESIRSVKGFSHFLLKPTKRDLEEAVALSPLFYIAETSHGGLGIYLKNTQRGLTVNSSFLPNLTSTNVKNLFHDTGGYYTVYKEWRLRSKDREASNNWLQTLSSSCNWLSEHIISALPKDIFDNKNITLIPVGQLALLPWHVVIPNSVMVGYAPNAQTLMKSYNLHQRLTKASAETRAFISIESTTSNEPLKFAHFEASCAQHAHLAVTHITPCVLENSKKDIVLEKLAHCNAFHFCGHALSIVQDPLQSYLALEHDNLTLEEIFQLRTQGIRLAVLSACETIMPGDNLPEESISLASGFLLARSASVVASLWSVPDHATALLMMIFYQYWESDPSSPRKALHSAQQWMRDTTNQEKLIHVKQFPESKTLQQLLSKYPPEENTFRNPYFWAAFICVGI